MVHYLFNLLLPPGWTGPDLRATASGFLEAGLWGVGPEEPHGDELAPGDRVLVYLAAPERVFVGRAELASPVQRWAPPEGLVWPADTTRGVVLGDVERWDPAVPMEEVLARIDPSANARGDFEVGVVGITPHEYAAALAAAGPRVGSAVEAPPRPPA